MQTPDKVASVIIDVDNVERLTSGQVSEVIDLSRTATRADEVAPLSEQALLAVQDAATPSTTDAAADSHFLAYAGMHLAGYAHLDRSAARQPGTAELVVDPAHRRQGIGTALIHALEDATPHHTQPEDTQLDAQLEPAVPEPPAPKPAAPEDAASEPAVPEDAVPEDAQAPRDETLRIWSHGDLDGARALARSGGYSIVRELWQMGRSLRSDAPSLPGISLPHGFRTRPFVVGQDEPAWLRVNSRAFVHHPEQGRMTRHDLDQRIGQQWFDANGLLLIEDTRGPVPVLAASHWTKVVPAEDTHTHPGPQPVGEVYVVGVDPAYQGLGLGRAVTVLGLAHLRAQGLAEAMLYVDADNRAAVATYLGLDFARRAVDIMYSRTVHLAV